MHSNAYDINRMPIESLIEGSMCYDFILKYSIEVTARQVLFFDSHQKRKVPWFF